MTKIDNIKVLYKNEAIQNDKNRFYEKVAEEFGLKVSSVRVGWFNRFEIQERYKTQENLIAFMQNYIIQQNQTKTAV